MLTKHYFFGKKMAQKFIKPLVAVCYLLLIIQSSKLNKMSNKFSSNDPVQKNAAIKAELEKIVPGIRVTIVGLKQITFMMDGMKTDWFNKVAEFYSEDIIHQRVYQDEDLNGTWLYLTLK